MELNTYIEQPVQAPHLFGENEEFSLEIANTIEARMEAWQQIYTLYRNPKINYVDPHPSRMWYTLYDALPDTLTLIVRERTHHSTIATVTIVIDSLAGLPMEKSYPVEIGKLRSQNKIAVELISLGIDDKFQGNREILTMVFLYAYYYVRGLKSATDYLIMICPRHAAFYKRYFQFQQIGDIVQCEKINNNPVGLYHLDIQSAEREVIENRGSGSGSRRLLFHDYPLAHENTKATEWIQNNQRELNRDELAFLFMEQRPIFQNIDPKILLKLARCYRNTEARAFLNEIYLYRIQEEEAVNSDYLFAETVPA